MARLRQILYISVFIVASSLALENRSPRNIPTNRCSEAGEQFCYSCASTGICRDDGNFGYYLELVEECTVACSEPMIGVAECGSTIASYCKCEPDEPLNCIDDILNDAQYPGSSFIVCAQGTPTYVQCENYETADVSSCDCVEVACPTTPCSGYYLPPFDNGCGLYYYCGGGTFVENNCNAYCWDETYCSCR